MTDYTIFDENKKEYPPMTELQLKENLERYYQGQETDQDEEDLVLYVIHEQLKSGNKFFNHDIITQRTGELRADYMLARMVDKGLLEPFCGETSEDDIFELTPVGEEYFKD